MDENNYPNWAYALMRIKQPGCRRGGRFPVWLLQNVSLSNASAGRSRQGRMSARGLGRAKTYAPQLSAPRQLRGAFAGFIGLSVPKRVLPFMPCVEVGYRLAQKYWGQGYATEGARAALDVGFNKLGLEEIVSFTAIANLPSQAVMQRIGMINAHEDFDHPALPEGSELRRHCLYRISRERWMATRNDA